MYIHGGPSFWAKRHCRHQFCNSGHVAQSLPLKSAPEEDNCFLTTSKILSRWRWQDFVCHQWLQNCHFAEEIFLIFFLPRLEAESMLLRQGRVSLECCLILAGHLKVMSSSTSMNKNTNSEILSEFEEGDFIGVNIVLISQSLIIFIFKNLKIMCHCIKTT